MLSVGINSLSFNHENEFFFLNHFFFKAITPNDTLKVTKQEQTCIHYINI